MIEIMGLPFLACVVFGIILGYFGFQVLRREIIFIDIALAQVAAVGTIVAHLAFDAEEESVLAYIFSFGCVAVMALFYALVRRRITQMSIEAVIGISFAVTTAAALFLVGVAPGHAHAQEILAGNLLWVTWGHVLWALVLAVTMGCCLGLFHRQFHKVSFSYQQAIENGVFVVWWDFLFYLLLGAVITLAVRVAGVVVVFAFLIIPATSAVLLFSGQTVQLLFAWGLAVAGSLLGLLFSYRFDFSVGPAVAFGLGCLLLLVAVLAKLRCILSKSQ